MTTTSRQPTDLSKYTAALRMYAAIMTDAMGVMIPGTCRELYVHGGGSLEWRANAFYERFIIRRNDKRLELLPEVV